MDPINVVKKGDSPSSKPSAKFDGYVHFESTPDGVRLIWEGDDLVADRKVLADSVRAVLTDNPFHTKQDANGFLTKVCILFGLPTDMIDLPQSELLDEVEASAKADPKDEPVVESEVEFKTRNSSNDGKLTIPDPFGDTPAQDDEEEDFDDDEDN